MQAVSAGWMGVSGGTHNVPHDWVTASMELAFNAMLSEDLLKSLRSGCDGHPNTKSSLLLVIFLLYAHEGWICQRRKGGSRG